MDDRRRRGQVMVIEPARRFPNLDCFNQLNRRSPLPLSYHLPALYGFASVEATELGSLRGVLVLGSAASVHDQPPWQERLARWLEALWGSHPVPTLGICYGHQLIAHLFGARIGAAFGDGHKRVGFRRVELEEPPAWAGPARALTLCVSHREAVLECPAALRPFASSEELAFEGIAHRELPIFGLQPHPEATGVFLDEHGISRVEEPRLAGGHALLDGFLELCAS